MTAATRTQKLMAVVLIATLALVAATNIDRAWRVTVPTTDIIGPANDALDFLQYGTIPHKGNVCSLGVHMPPGTTWLLVPGLWLFNDCRLMEYPATLVLYVLTLVGIYLLGVLVAHHYVACAAVIFYGLSQVGLNFVITLQPFARPCFFVWIIYFAAKWVVEHKPAYLAGSLFVWSMGMLVHMGTAPAILVIPVLWYIYRPPVSMRPLLVAAVAASLVWLPYVVYDANCGFVHTWDQLTLQSRWGRDRPILASDPRIRPPVQPRLAPAPSPNIDVRARVSRAVNKLHRGFTKLRECLNLGPVFASHHMNYVLLALFLCGLSVITLALLPRTRTSPLQQEPPPRYGRGSVFALCVIIALVVLQQTVLHHLGRDSEITPRKFFEAWAAVLVVAACVVFLFRKPLKGALTTLHEQIQSYLPEGWNPQAAGTLALGFAVPWLILFVLAGGFQQRFYQLWPLQVVLIAIGLGFVIDRLLGPRLRGVIILVAIVLALPANFGTPNSLWPRPPQSARDALPELEFVDFVASEIRKSGNHEAWIGYSIPFPNWLPDCRSLDPRYKVGMDLDFCFRKNHGITNLQTSPLGCSTEDQYRIVSSGLPESKEHRLDLPLEGFVPRFRKWGFTVYQRTSQLPVAQ